MVLYQETRSFAVIQLVLGVVAVIQAVIWPGPLGVRVLAMLAGLFGALFVFAVFEFAKNPRNNLLPFGLAVFLAAGVTAVVIGTGFGKLIRRIASRRPT